MAGINRSGFPRAICIFITYPSSEALPTISTLTSRLATLSELFPHLKAYFTGDSPESASWKKGEHALQVHELQYSEPFTPSDPRLFIDALQRGEKVDLRSGPLLRVDVIKPEDASSDSGNKEVYLAISANHILIDGGGLLRLVKCLLTDTPTPVPEQEEGQFDDMPDWPLINDQSIIMPPPPKGMWPASSVSPRDVDPAYLVYDFPPGLLSAIHAQAKLHGLTLNPVIEILFMISVWQVMDRPRPFSMVSNRDIRSQFSKAPAFGLNMYESLVTVSAVDPQADLWTTIKERDAQLKDPQTIQRAHIGITKLTSMPVPLEKIFIGQAQKPSPYLYSIFFTNLARVQLPPGASDLRWISSATPPMTPLLCHFVGHAGGLRMTVSTRDGAGVSKGQVEEVAKMFEMLLEKVGKGQGRTVEDLIRSA